MTPFILLGGVAALGYLAWKEGWLDSILGAVAPAATTTGTGAGTSSGSETNATIASRLMAAAAGATQLDMDQWSYYYQHLPDKGPISGVQFEQMLAHAGLTDATRTTPVPVATFVTALSSIGLGGMPMISDNGGPFIPGAWFGGTVIGGGF